MNCPQCNTELFCPCENCRQHEPERIRWINTQEWLVPKGVEKRVLVEGAKCPQCTYWNTHDGWLAIEMKQYYEKLKHDNPNNL